MEEVFEPGLAPRVSKVVYMIESFNMPMTNIVSEMVTNSVDAMAEKVWVTIAPKGNNVLQIMVADNGKGMNKDSLDEAIRLGSHRDYAPDSIGTFGAGLTMSWLCSRGTMTIMTKEEGGSVLYGYWDIERFGDDCARVMRPAREAEIKEFNDHTGGSHGTVINILADRAKAKLSDSGKPVHPTLLTDPRDRVMENLREVFREHIVGKNCRKVTIYGKNPKKNEEKWEWIKLTALDPLFRDREASILKKIDVRIALNDKGVPRIADDIEPCDGVVTIDMWMLPPESDRAIGKCYNPLLGEWRNSKASNNTGSRRIIFPVGFYILRDNYQVDRAVWKDLIDLGDKNEDGANEFANWFRGEIRYPQKFDHLISVEATKKGVHFSDWMLSTLGSIISRELPDIRKHIRVRTPRNSESKRRYLSNVKELGRIYGEIRQHFVWPLSLKRVSGGGGKKTGMGTSHQAISKNPPRGEMKMTDRAAGLKFRDAPMPIEKLHEIETSNGTITIVFNSNHPYYKAVIDHPNSAVRKYSMMCYANFVLGNMRMKDEFEIDEQEFIRHEADMSHNFRIFIEHDKADPTADKSKVADMSEVMDDASE